MRILSRQCRQCGVIIPQQYSNLQTRHEGFVITQISAICQNGHLQPSEFKNY